MDSVASVWSPVKFDSASELYAKYTKTTSIEGNLFSGLIPSEIGKLVNLEKLILSSNLFTGEFPQALAELINLLDMRITDNNFSGKIPDFIGNWTHLSKLLIQGCLLEGPIPSRISGLTNLIDLDLSYNQLTGKVPASFDQLTKADFIYLTANKLTGTVPGWVLKRIRTVDFSSNNFIWESSSSVPTQCDSGNVNLVESYSSAADNIGKTCLERNYPCPALTPNHYSLHVNCGGREMTLGGIKYEADTEQKGASFYYASPDENWAFSSTGNFMDNDVEADNYITSNTSALSNVSVSESELYTTARASAISLTYYGLCLMNGNYTIKLHFAEIIFTEDNSFSSLGERVFDVYIQDRRVLKDFNIEKEAGGTGKALSKMFTSVVQGNTLKIHLYWAGKGTTGIPDRGFYGPLISAISVDPNFEVPQDGIKKKVILSIGLSTAALLLLLVFGIMWEKVLGLIANTLMLFWAYAFGLYAYVVNGLR